MSFVKLCSFWRNLIYRRAFQRFEWNVTSPTHRPHRKYHISNYSNKSFNGNFFLSFLLLLRFDSTQQRVPFSSITYSQFISCTVDINPPAHTTRSSQSYEIFQLLVSSSRFRISLDFSCQFLIFDFRLEKSIKGKNCLWISLPNRVACKSEGSIESIIGFRVQRKNRFAIKKMQQKIPNWMQINFPVKWRINNSWWIPRRQKKLCNDTRWQKQQQKVETFMQI